MILFVAAIVNSELVSQIFLGPSPTEAQNPKLNEAQSLEIFGEPAPAAIRTLNPLSEQGCESQLPPKSKHLNKCKFKITGTNFSRLMTFDRS